MALYGRQHQRPEGEAGEPDRHGPAAGVGLRAQHGIMRHRRPDIERGFTVPALPFVAVAGMVTCGAMIYGLGWTNWLRLVAWLAVGLVIYLGYGRRHSMLATA